jgi:hypothetical protein
MTQPYKGLSLDRLVAAMNQANGTTFQHGVDFTLGYPVTVANNPSHNTKVVVIVPPNSLYEQFEPIAYTRLDISILDSVAKQPALLERYPFDVHSSLPQINEALGLDLQPSEVVQAFYQNPQPVFRLEINPNRSYAWFGNVGFSVKTVAGDDLALSQFVPNLLLNGLTWGDSNLNLENEQILIDLIKVNNPNTAGTLTNQGIEISNVGPNTPGSNRDTRALVTAIAGSGILGNVTIQYNRLDLGVLNHGVSLTFVVDDQLRVGDILPLINQRFNVRLTLDDIQQGEIPDFSFPTVTTRQMVLTARADSLVWQGSLTITVTKPDYQLGTLINNTVLEGLFYYPPV